MKKFITLLLIGCIAAISFFFFSCGSSSRKHRPEEMKGRISISGAFAMYPLTLKWVEEFKKTHPGITIDVSAGGAGKGMVDVLNNLVDIAMFSREVSPEEKAKGAWYISVAKDAVLPTISAANPAYKQLAATGMRKQDLIDIFITGKIKKWGQFSQGHTNAKIGVYTRSDACGAAEMWAKYLGKKQEDLLGIGIYSDPGISDAVKNDMYSIGYNNVAYAYDPKTKKNYEGIAIIPLDINENGVIDSTENFYGNLDKLTAAIKDGRYPSPPARDLYFVTKGKPANELVVEFLKFVVSEGQQYIHDAGYVTLSESKLASESLKLNP